MALKRLFAQEEQLSQSMPQDMPKKSGALPKAASTDPQVVDELQRKHKPSGRQMQAAYRWLCSFNMEFRIRGRCKPDKASEFLIDALPDDLRHEFSECDDLRWRDWHTCYTSLERELEESRHLMTQRLKGLDAQIGIDIDWSVPMTTADLEDLLQCLEHMAKEVHQP